MKQEANQKIKSGIRIWQVKEKSSSLKSFLRRCLRRCTGDGKLFQKLAPETGKARLATLEWLNGGTANLLRGRRLESLPIPGSTASPWSWKYLTFIYASKMGSCEAYPTDFQAFWATLSMQWKIFFVSCHFHANSCSYYISCHSQDIICDRNLWVGELHCNVIYLESWSLPIIL